MSDQRLAAMSLDELYQMAHGGQPEAAAASQRGFTSVSATLRQVWQTINEPLSGIGMGWGGQASQAAQAGIGQHAQWAEQAAARASTTAGQAGQYYTSAKNVIANMPDPASIPGTSGGAAGATDLAAVEQAQANAKQRAVELMQGHADVCQLATPKTGFAPPPTAGAAGGVARAAAVTEEAPGGRSVSRVTPPGGAAEGAPATAEAAGATTTAGAVEQPSPASGAGATVAAGAETGPGSVRGSQPGVLGEMVPAGTGFLPVGSTRTRGGRVLSPRGGTGAAEAGPYAGGERARRRVGPVAEALPPAGAGAMSREGQHPTRRAVQRPLPRGDGHPLDGHRADLAAAPAGVLGSGSAGHQGYGQHPAGLPGGMMPPVMGGPGTTDSEQQHQAPDYLLDDVDLFDGNSWVTPPVIGR